MSAPIVCKRVAALADDTRCACVWGLFDLQLMLLPPLICFIILNPTTTSQAWSSH